jgi:hypothetical protein
MRFSSFVIACPWNHFPDRMGAKTAEFAAESLIISGWPRKHPPMAYL